MLPEIINSLIYAGNTGLFQAAAQQARQQEANAKRWAGHEFVEYIRQKEKVNELKYWQQAWGEESRVLARSVQLGTA